MRTRKEIEASRNQADTARPELRMVKLLDVILEVLLDIRDLALMNNMSPHDEG